MGKIEWRTCPVLYGAGYEVSNDGQVRRNEKILKQSTDHGGYSTVKLYSHSKYKCYRVHRLVALAFIDNPEGKRTVNHINGNKKDNRLENLEWATHSENLLHASRTGLKTPSEKQRAAASKTGKRTCNTNRPRKPVVRIKGDERVVFVSAHEGARSVNGSPTAVVRCCKGKAKSCKGYIWEYANG